MTRWLILGPGAPPFPPNGQMPPFPPAANNNLPPGGIPGPPGPPGNFSGPPLATANGSPPPPAGGLPGGMHPDRLRMLGK